MKRYKPGKSDTRKSLYKTVRWQSLRAAQLGKQPLCVMCMQLGMIVSAAVVDHIVMHKGNDHLFSDPDNLQSLCKRCHDSHKQRQDRTGSLQGGNAKGFPIDVNHHWGINKGGEGSKD